MSGAVLGGAIAAAATLGSAYMNNQAQAKASRAQSDAQARALALQKDEASKAEQAQNRVNKQQVNAGAILGQTMGQGAYGALTGGQGVTNGMSLGGNTLLGSDDLLG